MRVTCPLHRDIELIHTKLPNGETKDYCPDAKSYLEKRYDSSLYALIVFVLPSVDTSVTRTILTSASEVNMRGSTFSIL